MSYSKFLQFFVEAGTLCASLRGRLRYASRVEPGAGFLVPEAGIEPARPYSEPRILSPVCLPIPPLGLLLAPAKLGLAKVRVRLRRILLKTPIASGVIIHLFYN